MSAADVEEKVMISVRRSQYRGVEGFLVCGRRKGQEGGFGVSIFCLTRPVAEKIREAAKIEDWTAVDQLLGNETLNGHYPRKK